MHACFPSHASTLQVTKSGAEAPAASTFAVGAQVEGLYPNGRWYPAVVSQVHDGGDAFTLDWEDGDANHKRQPASNVRARPGAATGSCECSSPQTCRPIGLVAYPMRCVHRHRPYLPGPAASSRARGRRPRHALGVRRRHSDRYVHEDPILIGLIGCFLRLVRSLTGFKHAGTRTGDTSGGLTSDGCEHASAESCAMLCRRLINAALQTCAFGLTPVTATPLDGM